VAADDPGTALTKVPVRVGVIPTSVEEVWRLAQMFARSELVPKAFRGRADDIVVAIVMGAEIGFAAWQAVQSIAVINGRPGLYAEGLLGRIMASPLYVDHDEYFLVNADHRDELTAEDLKLDTTAAVCTFIRKGKALPVTRRFSVADAKRANLLGKAGPWTEYPSRMLRMRARSFAARDTFPDVLRGIRAVEELGDIPPEPEAARTVRRLSDPPEPAPVVEAAAPALDDEILDAEIAHE
jgi:hypothetical protein